jgi:glycerol-3-phosphate dehydrogenase
MAEETLDRAINEGLLEKSKCITSGLRLTNINAGIQNRLNIYGDHLQDIEKLISGSPGLGIPIDSRLPYTRAEIVWICRNEMPSNIEDILARRTRALFLNARASADIAPEVAEIMAKELGYDKEWGNMQVESYNQLIRNYI